MRWLSGGIGLALIGAALALLVPAGQSAGVQRPAFAFGVPGSIPDAVAGRKYPGVWFCRPQPAGARQCGAGYVTTNPKGGFPPYTFSLRNVVPGLHVNLRTGLLFGTVPKGAQKREWLFTVCATESRTPKYQQPRTRCDETSITIKGAAPQVTIPAYVARMQTEAQKWHAGWERHRAPLTATCQDFLASYAGLTSEFAGFAANVATIPAPSNLKAAHAKLVLAHRAFSEGFGAVASSSCPPGRGFPTGVESGTYQAKLVLAEALMLEWADAVVEAARAAGITVGRASLLCCNVGG